MGALKNKFMDDDGKMLEEDFYDLMTSKKWLKAAAEQYNKDTEEDSMRSVTEEVKSYKQGNYGYLEEGLNGTSSKDLESVINPKHYKDVAYGYQYIQLMVPMLERFDGITAHLMGQTYKYLMRAGNKDPLKQDLKKAQWYLNALVEYVNTGKISVGE